MKEKFKYGLTCAGLLIVLIGLEIWGLILDYNIYSDIIECIKMFIQSLTR